MLGEYDQVLCALVQQLKLTSQEISQMDCTLQGIHSKFTPTFCYKAPCWLNSLLELYQMISHMVGLLVGPLVRVDLGMFNN